MVAVEGVPLRPLNDLNSKRVYFTSQKGIERESRNRSSLIQERDNGRTGLLQSVGSL